MTENNEKQPDATRSNRPVPTVSAVLADGAIVETVFDREARRTAFAVWRDGTWRTEPLVTTDSGERLVPYSANNNLEGAVVLYESNATLVQDPSGDVVIGHAGIREVIRIAGRGGWPRRGESLWIGTSPGRRGGRGRWCGR